ncbi:MAG TPA: sialidase family protein, partial [Actinomycetota bacterium]
MRSRTVLRWIGLAGALALIALVPSVNAKAPKRRVWSKPVLVSHEFAHRETSIAINPSDRNPKHIFVCDPSGVPNTQHNQSFFHLSKDGGKSWEFIRVENDFGDSRNYFFEGGDCDVAMDSSGTLYTADTWLGSLSIGHSRDAGKTWQGTAIAGTSPMVDRPWLVAGEEGTVYVTYQDVQCCTPSAIWFTKSTDYGQTFAPAVPVTTFAGGVPADPTEGPDGAYTWEGNFVVAGEGQDLYLVYTRRQAPAVTEQSGPETVNVAVSHDG